ncbi:MAG: hypothetical protein KatS3mg076_2302 [Candidatus Binatia bacterium]|nr:MAG: hypothetical protein KatS3mg076_2302 [Candidatus Binatia bacterium]
MTVSPGARTIFGMREFLYGVIVGAAAVYLYTYFDAAGALDALNRWTASAVQAARGYSDGSPRAAR